MTALDQLNAYLRRLELRMRQLAATRGAAIIALAAVLLTAVLAWVCNRFAFADRVVLPVRILLYLSIAAAICFGLVIPLLRLNRRWVAKRAEQQMHGFDERLLTLAERGFFVPPIRYPTVARDAARLRVTISAKHTPKQITALCEQLRTLLPAERAAPL